MLGIVNRAATSETHVYQAGQHRHVDAYEDTAQPAQDWPQGNWTPLPSLNSERWLIFAGQEYGHQMQVRSLRTLVTIRRHD
jgi:hypothetical protein